MLDQLKTLVKHCGVPLPRYAAFILIYPACFNTRFRYALNV